MEKDVRIKTMKCNVAGACSAVVSEISEKGPFLLRQILVPAEVARYFMVTDVKVGNNSQFIGSGCVPASFFTEEEAPERQRELVFDVLPRGRFLSLAVTCMSKEARDFEAVFVGDVLREDEVKEAARGRRVFLGLGSTLVRAQSAVKISAQPQVVLRPDLFVLPPKVSDAFRILDVRAVGVSAADCSKQQEGTVALTSPVMQIADWFTVEVENKADEPRNFQGTVVGELVKHTSTP